MDKNKSSKESKQSLPHVRRLKNLKRQSDVKETRNSRPRKDEIVLESVLGFTVSNTSCLQISKTGWLAYPAGCVVVLLNLDTGDQRHIINEERKTVTCLSWSSDAQHLVTGESGHRPCVRVWSVSTLSLVSTLPGHKFGLSCVSFTGDDDHVVAAGAEHDMTINVWDWRNNKKIASNKISFHVKSISIAHNGTCFVAAGNRHLKYWYVDSKQKTASGTIPLIGRSAILGDKRNNNFLDVKFGLGELREHVFAITKSGLLCQLNNQRLLEKWVELKVKSASCLDVYNQYVLVGCSEGIIRCFCASSLQYVCSLPRPDSTSPPDVVSMSSGLTSLSVVYTDHSLMVWNISNINSVSLVKQFNYHSSCVWGVDSYQGGLSSGCCLVTCSSDETIRVWSLDTSPLSHSGLECHLQKMISVPGESGDQEKRGVRCVSVSPDQSFITSGDRAGNIRVHTTRNYSELCKIEAHDSEILTLKFSDNKFLASGSRDRLVHLFDASNNFEFLTTVEDHSACVTAVDFIKTRDDEDILVTSGSDRSILCRKILTDSEGVISTSRSHHTVCKTVPYDMTAGVEDDILVACQDRSVRVFSSSQPMSKPKMLKGSSSDDGSLLRLTLDRSGSYFATSCSDKTIGVFNYQTGEMIGSLVGHSDPVTGLVFSHDCRYLVTVSGDSCIFLWKLPRKMFTSMSSKLNLSSVDEPTTAALENVEEEEFGSPTQEFLNTDPLSPGTLYRFSVGKLPVWARKKVASGQDLQSSSSPAPVSPRGRWATLRDKPGDGEEAGADILERFQDDDEPDVGSVDKTKKLLFNKEDDNSGDWQVQTIDADTLRRSQKEMSIPAESSLLTDETQEEQDVDVEDDHAKPEEKVMTDFLNDDDNLQGNKVLRSSSISHAWREGLTPVQQRKNALSNNISIEKLLATNQLHALMKNATPAKSPCVRNSAIQSSGVTESGDKPRLSLRSETKKLDTSTEHLCSDLIKEASSQVKEATEQLLVLFKRVSLDDDLDDNLREEMTKELSSAAFQGVETLRLVQNNNCPVSAGVKTHEDSRSHEEIASSAMENIRRFLSNNS